MALADDDDEDADEDKGGQGGQGGQGRPHQDRWPEETSSFVLVEKKMRNY